LRIVNGDDVRNKTTCTYISARVYRSRVAGNR